MQLFLLGCALGILISFLRHRFVVRPALEKAIGELLELRRIITGAAVLTERDIALIRELYQQGQTLTAIAKHFGVSRQHISKIANRKS